MLKAGTYRQFASECRRIAEGMNGKDRETLLKIAEAWDERAREAERKDDRIGDRV